MSIIPYLISVLMVLGNSRQPNLLDRTHFSRKFGSDPTRTIVLSVDGWVAIESITGEAIEPLDRRSLY